MERLVVVGIAHNTGAFSALQRVAMSADEVGRVARLLQDLGLPEPVILSTCNRVEIYHAGAAPRVELIRDVIVEVKGAGAVPVEAFFVRAGADAVEHLFRVAKRVRTETDIARGHFSVALTAIQVFENRLGGWCPQRVLVVGAGKTGELAARHFRERTCSESTLANRTRARPSAWPRRSAARACSTSIRWGRPRPSSTSWSRRSRAACACSRPETSASARLPCTWSTCRCRPAWTPRWRTSLAST